MLLVQKKDVHTIAIPVSAFIGKLRLHVQGYVDQEEIIAQVDELVEKGMVP